VSVLFSCAVAVLINLATAGNASGAALGGLAAGIVAWASWEAIRAGRPPDDHG
jgi:hypothetical protein